MKGGWLCFEWWLVSAFCVLVSVWFLLEPFNFKFHWVWALSSIFQIKWTFRGSCVVHWGEAATEGRDQLNLPWITPRGTHFCKNLPFVNLWSYPSIRFKEKHPPPRSHCFGITAGSKAGSKGKLGKGKIEERNRKRKVWWPCLSHTTFFFTDQTVSHWMMKEVWSCLSPTLAFVGLSHYFHFPNLLYAPFLPAPAQFHFQNAENSDAMECWVGVKVGHFSHLR